MADSVIRRLLVTFGAKTDTKKVKDYEDAVDDAADANKRASASTMEWANSIKGKLAAALAGIGFAKIINDVNESAFEIDNWSQSLGVSRQAAQAYGLAMESVGLGIEDFADATFTTSERLFDAMADPASEAGVMAKQLGLSLKDEAGNVKETEQIFLEFADAMAAIKEPAEQVAQASIFMGDAGIRMLPLLQKGSAGILEMREEMVAMGAIMDDQTFDSIAAYRESLRKTSLIMDGMKQKIAVAVMPIITKLTDRFNQWAMGGGNVEAMMKKIAGAVDILKAVLAGFAVGAAVGLFMQLASAARMAMLAIQALGIKAAIAGAAVAAIPLALAAIVLLAEDLHGWVNGANSATGKFIEKFKDADGILGTMARTLENNKGNIKAFFDGGLGGAGDFFALVSEGFTGITEWLTDTASGISDYVSEAGAPIFDFIGQVVDFAKSAFAKLRPAFAVYFRLAAKFWTTIASVLFRIFGVAKNVFIKIQSAVLSAWARVAAILGVALTKLTPTLLWIFEKISWLFTTLEPLVSGLFTFIGDLLKGAVGIWESVFDTFFGVVKGLLSGALGIAENLFNGTLDIILPILTNVKTAFDNLISGVTAAFTNSKTALGTFNAVLKTIFDSWMLLAATAAETIANSMIGAVNAGIDALNSLLRKAGSVASYLPGVDDLDLTLSNVAEVDLTSRLREQAASQTQNNNAQNVTVGQITVENTAPPTAGAATQAREGIFTGWRAAMDEAARDYSAG